MSKAFTTAARTLVAVMTLTITSCEIESEIDYATIYGGDKIVLYGFLSEAEGVFATIKKTVPPNTPQANGAIYDATLLLLTDGTISDTLRSDNHTNYRLTNTQTKLTTGHKYSLRAESPTYGTALSAEVELPEPVQLEALIFDSLTHTYYASFHNPSAENAYCVKYHPYKNGEDNFMGHYLSDYPTTNIASGSALLEVSRMGVSMNFDHPDSARVDLVVYSSELKSFFKSYNDYQDTRNDVYYEMAYPVESNVSGGYGFVGTCAISSITVKSGQTRE